MWKEREEEEWKCAGMNWSFWKRKWEKKRTQIVRALANQEKALNLSSIWSTLRAIADFLPALLYFCPIWSSLFHISPFSYIDACIQFLTSYSWKTWWWCPASALNTLLCVLYCLNLSARINSHLSFWGSVCLSVCECVCVPGVCHLLGHFLLYSTSPSRFTVGLEQRSEFRVKHLHECNLEYDWRGGGGGCGGRVMIPIIIWSSENTTPPP